MARDASYTIKDMPRAFWKKVKFLAVERETTIRDMIIEFLQKEIEKSEGSEDLNEKQEPYKIICPA